jgi:hypothetical protein
MHKCMFSVRCRLPLHLFEGGIRSVRAECEWLRTQELQARLDAATGNRGRLTRELEARDVQGPKGEGRKFIDLTHHVSETKGEGEMEMQTMKRTR